MTGPFFDVGSLLRLLVWLAVPGAIAVTGTLAWLIYHLIMAIWLYVAAP